MSAPPVPTIFLTLNAKRDTGPAFNTLYLSGSVTPPPPAGFTYTIIFISDELPSLAGLECKADAQGNFSTQTKIGSLEQGNAKAQTQDWNGIFSNIGASFVPHGPPILAVFQATLEPGGERVWTFSGSVVAYQYSGMFVYFGGLPTLQGQAINVQNDGTFRIQRQLQPGENGTAGAYAVDELGQASRVLTAVVAGN